MIVMMKILKKNIHFDTFTDFINGLQELHNFLLDTHNTEYIDKMEDMFLSIQRLNKEDKKNVSKYTWVIKR